MWEVAFWNSSRAVGRGIERTSIVPDVAVSARFPHEVTIHQGRIERIFEDDLRRYSSRGVQRASRVNNVSIDEGDPEFPVVVDIESPTGQRTVRAKYLIGADGAHSVVRKSMDLKLQGETSDFIWGVVDFVAETDFPDIRRRCAIHSDNGSVMVIPREKIQTGEYLTRLYVHVQDDVKPESDIASEEGIKGEGKSDSRARRERITLESIFKQAEGVFKPYKIGPRRPDAVDWWAAYQIGQRTAEHFTKRDSKGVNRVFIVGDGELVLIFLVCATADFHKACHTHSPKAGQGMNVSMMDSYNLSWKLLHSLNGLTPYPQGSVDKILDTYEQERQTVAQQLIAFDKEFSSMFSGKIGAENDKEGLTHEQFLDVFSTGNGFTSGCGIEYPENLSVQMRVPEGVIDGKDYLKGILRPGRRLLNVKVKRHADGARRDFQDGTLAIFTFHARTNLVDTDFPSTGRFRILCCTSSDLLLPTGASAGALIAISTLLQRFPVGIIEIVALHALPSNSFVWTDVPAVLREEAEMRFYNGTELENAYSVYGVDPEKGAVAVVRPDGYIGTVSALEDVDRVRLYLKGCLREVGELADGLR